MTKTAVITGSAAGLGKGIAQRLANDGFNIVIQDINQKALEKTEQEFKENGYNVVAFHSDVSKKKEQEELVQFAVAEFGQIDVFVNNAFGTAHGEHTSNVGIYTHLEAAAGYIKKKEIKFIGGVVNDPHKPVVAILGGAKVSDKIGVIKNLVNIADKIIIGGGMAYTFLKAQGKEIGLSLLEEDKIDFAKELLEKNGDQIVLPVDCKVAKEFSNDAKITEVSIDEIPSDQEAMDIGPKTIELFTKELQGAHTVVWNGPMGVFEFSNFAKGTIGVCKAIANLEDAITIIGGGDSAAAAISLGFEEDFTHISTGGGASLEYLEGKELPGIKAINDK